MILWTDDEILGRLRTRIFLGNNEAPLLAVIKDLLTETGETAAQIARGSVSADQETLLAEARSSAHAEGYSEGFADSEKKHVEKAHRFDESKLQAEYARGVAAAKEEYDARFQELVEEKVQARLNAIRAAATKDWLEQALELPEGWDGDDFTLAKTMAARVAQAATAASKAPAARGLGRLIGEEIMLIEKPEKPKKPRS